jgi:hypothetical protein
VPETEDQKNALRKAIFYWFVSLAVSRGLNDPEKIAQMTEFSTTGASIASNQQDCVME